MASDMRTIKKYPNRRLYDTANSGYITLADVKQMVLEGIEFQVVDAKTGDDLTRPILLQIILDEEAGGMPMFSSEMLSQMIRFYGSAQQTIMGQYIEQNVQAFLAIQKKLQDQAKQVYGDKMMLTPELWKQFMQMQAPAMQGMLGNYLEQSAQSVHRHAAADAGPDARHVFGVSVSRVRHAAANCHRTTNRSADRLSAAVGATMSARRARRLLQRAETLPSFPACDPHDPVTSFPQSRIAPRRVCLAGVPEGARRLRADPDATARRGVCGRALVRRRRSRRRQYVRIHRCRGRRIAGRDRRGAARERQGHRHRLSRRPARR